MANFIVEGRRPSEFIVSEANGRRGRDAVTVASGADLGSAVVVGKVTANGKMAQLAPAASDGSETAYGILIYPAGAATADAVVTAIVREAEINGELIVWPEGITEGQKTTAIADLEARGLIIR